jgi:hypothetical protein
VIVLRSVRRGGSRATNFALLTPEVDDNPELSHFAASDGESLEAPVRARICGRATFMVK